MNRVATTSNPANTIERVGQSLNLHMEVMRCAALAGSRSALDLRSCAASLEAAAASLAALQVESAPVQAAVDSIRLIAGLLHAAEGRRNRSDLRLLSCAAVLELAASTLARERAVR